MLSLFNSKISLCDVLRTGFIDYHSHVLHGIDDGSTHIKQSLSLISELQAIGAHTIYCTPHIMYSVYNNTAETILPVYQSTLDATANTGIQLKLAAEYMLDDGFAKQLKTRPLLTYPNGEVLVEMNYVRAPLSLHQHIFELRTSGYTPVLAHPERYAYYHDNMEHFEQLRELGCKFQLNLLSLGTYYGKTCSKVAQYLLQNRFYTHVGTDTHKLRHIEAIRSIKIKKHQAACLAEILER